jgi:hypothetical protein
MNRSVLLCEIANRDAVGEEERKLKGFVEAACGYLNRVFSKSLQVKAEYKEQKIQSIFSGATAAFLYYRLLKLLLYPLQIKAGIGEGKIYLEELKTLDGPAYFNACQALEHSLREDFNLCYISFSKSDRYLNALLQASDYLDRKQSISTNLIKLMAELYFPLFKKNAMDFFEFREDRNFLKALEYKQYFYDVLSESDTSIKGIYPQAKNYRLPELADCEIYNLEDLCSKDRPEILNCFWKRGFASKIASSINNTTRQNVEKHLESGISFQRNLDGAIALMLGEKKNLFP